ncbi:MAG: PAS domain-containing protein [Gemmatimonadaceae bacterium]|nr:PAS domain-containing protein [Gemmatimonadaceae bacterium]
MLLDSARPSGWRRTLAARLQRRVWAVTGAYALFASIWIAFSDRLLLTLAGSAERFVQFSVYKGLLFVAVTSAMLFLVLRRMLDAVAAREVRERQRYETRMAGQHRILEHVAHGETLSISLDEIVRFIETQVPDMLGSILLLDSEGTRLHHGAGPSLPAEYMAAIDGATIGPAAGSCGTAAFTNVPVYVEDIATDARWTDYKHLALPHGLRACWSTPIRTASGEVLGTFAMYFRRPALPRQEHLILVEIATQLASIAITRARTEQALRESEARFLAFMDAAPAVAWVTDEDGRHVYMNRAWSLAFGRDREAFIGRRADDLVPNDVAERIWASDREVLESNAPVYIPEDRTEYGGVTHWWNVVKFPFRNASGERLLGGVAIDITARKRMEKELHATRARIAVVVENLREGLIITDPVGGFLHWNPAALRMVGFDDPEVGRASQREFQRYFDIYTPDGDKLGVADWPLARVRRGETLDGFEVRVHRKNSDWVRYFSYSGGCVALESGDELAFVTLQDVTERRAQDTQLRELNTSLELRVEQRTHELRVALQRAESADRLKSAFLATMSHELRTPLNSIIGFTGILLQRLAGPLNDEQSRQMEMVRGSARHLLSLINDVLDISKIEAGQLEVAPESFALSPVLDRLLATMKPQADRKGLAIELLVEDAPEQLDTDRRRVEQILLNLLSNGVKFTDRGQVTLRVSTVANFARTSNEAAVPAVRFVVQDTGIGISERDLAALFQPFRQVDSGLARQHEGTGLGLSICRRLCELLGGEVQVTSTPGIGSSFTVTLPTHLRRPA